MPLVQVEDDLYGAPRYRKVNVGEVVSPLFQSYNPGSQKPKWQMTYMEKADNYVVTEESVSLYRAPNSIFGWVICIVLLGCRRISTIFPR